MDIIEVSNKILGIVVISEITIQFLKIYISLERLKLIKPYIAILISLLFSFLENIHNIDIGLIIKVGLFEYASISMMSYEIIVKRIFGGIYKQIDNNNEEPKNI